MPSSNPVILPPTYYLTYFWDVINFVQDKYAPILSERELQFIDDFGKLTKEAQCMFVRCCNRKGLLFRQDKLVYEEIPDTAAACEELRAAGFTSIEVPFAYETFDLFTKPELLRLFPEALKSWKTAPKAEVLEYLIQEESNLDTLLEAQSLFVLQKETEYEFIKLLFFGNYKIPMTEFVIRDIGNVQLEKLDENAFQPWCHSREEALAFFEISELKSTIRTLLKVLPAKDIHDALGSVKWDAFQPYPKSSKALSKIAMALGRQLEREKELEIALHYYRLTEYPPSRERQIRILDALQQTEEAGKLAHEVLDTFKSIEERTFAQDFLSRSKKRINRSMTSRLAEASTIEVRALPGLSVEQNVLAHLAVQGWEGIHSENVLWRNLFVLVFWDQLFDMEEQAFHHPLQRASSDLRDVAFYEKRKEKLQQHLKTLNSRKKWSTHIHQTHEVKYGLAHPLIYWYDKMLTPLDQLIQRLSVKQLRTILITMAKNLKTNSTGFPDLFVWNDKAYAFYEVKSPNDQLSAQQLFWINFMTDLGINIDILKTSYVEI